MLRGTKRSENEVVAPEEEEVYIHHIKSECATMCYIKEYISEYILG
jgi:hypothetical protein